MALQMAEGKRLLKGLGLRLAHRGDLAREEQAMPSYSALSCRIWVHRIKTRLATTNGFALRYSNWNAPENEPIRHLQFPTFAV